VAVTESTVNSIVAEHLYRLPSAALLKNSVVLVSIPAIGATVVAQPVVEYPLQVKLTESDVTSPSSATNV